MKLSKSLSTLLFALALLVVGAALRSHLADPPSSRPAVDPVEVDATLSWCVGELRSYELCVETSVRVSVLGDPSDSRIEQRLAGTLHLRVLEAESSRVLLGCELHAASLTRDGVRDLALDERLGAPFQASWSSDGRLIALKLSTQLSGEEGAILEEALRSFQVVVPPHAGTRWSTRERCGAGTFVADYELVGAGGALVKVKSAFTEGQGGSQVEVVSSEASIELAEAKTWIESCELREELDVEVHGTNLRAVTVAHLKSIEPLQQSPAIFDPAFRYRDLAARENLGEQGRPKEASVALVLDAELRALYFTLIEVLNTSSRLDQSTVNGLRDLFLRCPGATELVPATLLEPASSKLTRKALLHALELASTPSAQVVLGRVIEDELQSHEDRIGALIAVGGLVDPQGTTIDFLWRTAALRVGPLEQDLANTACLSLGCLASSLKETHPAAYESLRVNLVQGLGGAQFAEERAAFLKALSNTGDEALADVAAPYLVDESPTVRSAAARALGAMDCERSLIVLRDSLHAERTARVRRALTRGLGALSRTDEETLKLVQLLAAVEPDEGARFAMVHYLGERLERFPDGELTLRAQFDAEDSDRIRRYISDRLFELR